MSSWSLIHLPGSQPFALLPYHLSRFQAYWSWCPGWPNTWSLQLPHNCTLREMPFLKYRTWLPHSCQKAWWCNRGGKLTLAEWGKWYILQENRGNWRTSLSSFLPKLFWDPELSLSLWRHLAWLRERSQLSHCSCLRCMAVMRQKQFKGSWDIALCCFSHCLASLSLPILATWDYTLCQHLHFIFIPDLYISKIRSGHLSMKKTQKWKIYTQRCPTLAIHKLGFRPKEIH